MINNSTKKSRGFSFYLKTFVSIILIAYVFHKVGWSQLLLTLKNTNGVFLALCVSITPILILISSSKWQILLRAQGIKVSLPRLFFLYLVGYFFNNVLPSNVGGDIVRAYELSKYTTKKAESLASVFLERFTGLTALIFFALIAYFISVSSVADNRLTLAIGIAALGYLSILTLILNRKILGFVEKKVKYKVVKKVMEKFTKFQDAIKAYKNKKRTLVYAMVNSVIFYVIAVANVYLGCLAFGTNISFTKLLLVVPLVLVISMIPITIGGIGLSEWAYVFAFTSLVGATASLGLSVALLMRAKNLSFGLIGGVFFSTLGSRQKDRIVSSAEKKGGYGGFHSVVGDQSKSPLRKYQEVVVGSHKIWDLVKFEILTLSLGYLPGLVGLFLRQIFYRFLFKKMGRGAVIGRDVVLRHPNRISIGAKTIIDDHSVLTAQGSDGSEIIIGNNCFIGRGTIVTTRDGMIIIKDGADIGANCRIASTGKVVIGEYVLIAAFSYIGGANHRFDRTDIPIAFQGLDRRGGVIIEDDVWIGANVKINDGVKIGKGSVIGAGSVVTKDIPPYSIAFGVPAQVRGSRMKLVEGEGSKS